MPLTRLPPFTSWLGAALLLVLPLHAAAQPPSANWRVVDTGSFRIHYPAPYEPWTLRLAARLESIRARVAHEVGYTPAVRVDVVVMDPLSSPNGMAIPLLGTPRMVLWTTPPGPDSVIGHYRDWGELLAVHEDVHLVHLLRPSRNPVLSFLERTVLPLGPVTRQAPRWVIEGYATLLEGQITGFGRPPGDMRAAILRRWAQHGQLPSYERLSADPERWHGMSMAYLAGSAYLEWLIERTDPDSLRRLWARMTARNVRTFDAAFRGVFGDSPEALYGRFSAELVQRSMQAETIVEPVRRDGELWQRLERATGVPALSPDGERLAVVLRAHRRPARLVVFSTGPDEEAEREWRERMARMLALDPEDHPPVRDEPLPRTPLHVLTARHGAEPIHPRWMPDGQSMIFVRYEPDRDGVLHPDLFRWHPDGGRVDRVTRRASVHAADPMPDGRSAAAVRIRYGASQLVRVDLSTGSLTPITEPSVEVAYDSPRVSPDGMRLAYLRNDEDGWRAVIRDLASGAETVLATPAHATLAHPAWSDDGQHLLLSIGEHGFIDIHMVPALGTGPMRAVTRTHGAALGATPVPGGGLYFLGLEPRGLDLRYIERDPWGEPLPALPETLRPAVPPQAAAAPEWRRQPVEPGRPVGVGRQEFLPLVGGAYASVARALELGVRGGDLLGRLNYLAIGSRAPGEQGPRGAALAAAWRGWPATIDVHAFTADETPSRLPLQEAAIAPLLDANRRGVEGAVGWERIGRPVSLAARGGGLAGSVQPAGAGRLTQRVAFVQGRYDSRFGWDRWHASFAGDLRLDAGRTSDDTWQRATVVLEAGAGHGPRTVFAQFEERVLSGAVNPVDRILIGGLPSSILPSTVDAGRRDAPAVPLGTLTGEEHRAFRLAVAPGPIRWFYERHRVRERGDTWSDPLTWVGAEVRFSSRPVPLVLLPGADVLFGIARVDDAPAGSRTRWWAGLRWRP
jgi:hypothetical protein